jgi:hypothetical protein
MNRHITNLRSHLQIAILAIGQLHHKGRLSCEAKRLVERADDALVAAQQDVEAVSGVVARYEDREASRTAHLHLRQAHARRTLNERCDVA